MKRKTKRIIKYILILILPILLSVGGYYVYNNYIRKPGIPSVNKLIADKKKIGYSDKDDNKLETVAYENPLPGLREQYGNSQIMGRLQIPNLNIDTPITRTTDNGYYLNYNLYGVWDGLGVPFFDYRNTDLNTNRQINIYGHNTQNEQFYSQLPFTNLEAYVDENIFNNYKDVYLSIDERLLHYEVVAIKILTDNNPEHMVLEYSSSTDYLNHLSKMMSGSLYISEDANFTSSDRALVLQVCHYNPMGSYVLVICKEKK